MKSENKNEQIKKVTKNIALWTLLWLISLAMATFGPKFLWEQNTNWSILAIAINTAFGAGMIWANIKHISVLDELQKKIQGALRTNGWTKRKNMGRFSNSGFWTRGNKARKPNCW